jgi:serine/threonine protein phosphatase 1
MLNTTPILKLPTNTTGKDYVVGDLHGCYDLLESLLGAVSFDKTKDRLFSVGDLIDRGPNSLRCLELLFEPWFFAVQGNHELMLLDFFIPYLNEGKLERFEDLEDNGFLEYGGKWVEGYFEPEKQQMTRAFGLCLLEVLKMPLMLIVGDGETRFHVIHAELVKHDRKQTGELVWLDSDIDSWLVKNEIPPEVEDRLYWGRTLMMNLANNPDYPENQAGLSTTFCGHTFANSPRRLLSHMNIDTGAFMPLMTMVPIEGVFSLTLYNVHESRWLSASYQRNEIVEG